MSEKMRNQTIRLPNELDGIIEVNASSLGISKAEYIRKIIREGIDEPDQINFTWHDIKDKMVTAIAKIINSDTQCMDTLLLIDDIKNKFPELFVRPKAESFNVNRDSLEIYLLEKIQKLKKIYNVSRRGMASIYLVILTYFSIIYNNQVIEPFGMAIEFMKEFHNWENID